nr:uncharacterized protein LOC111858090 isoform X5 [Paramormyrops kingsleyae]
MECWEMYIGLWPVLHSFFFCLLTYFISVTLREGLLFWLLVLGAVCAAVILLFDIFYFYDKFWKRATPEFPVDDVKGAHVSEENQDQIRCPRKDIRIAKLKKRVVWLMALCGMNGMKKRAVKLMWM